MANHSKDLVFQTASKGIVRHPLAPKLIELLDGHLEQSLIAKNPIPNVTQTFVGWGYKGSGQWARNQAKQKNCNFLLLEDGFVRSLYPGYKYGAVYSIIADKSGIYYDADGKSDLQKFLNEDIEAPDHWSPIPPANESKKLLKLIRNSGVSKYNCHTQKKHSNSKGILVVDQTKGDAAISHGGMKEADFDLMLRTAIEENPDTIIYVKTHPDHHHREKKSCFSNELLEHNQIIILGPDFTPKECFSFCEKVYVGTSLMGMEALIHGCKVITYGWNFYAGWGLTTDRSSQPSPPRTRTLTLEQLFEAAYLRYTLYFDPDNGQSCGLGRIIEHICFQHTHWDKSSSQYCAYGLSLWKKFVLPKYTFPRKPLSQSKSIRKIAKLANKDTKLFVWGKKNVPSSLQHLPLTRIEDGFIRSRGLGAQFNFPLSWVFDDSGIYFDSTSPSRLENLLQSHDFSETDLEQAKELIDFLTTQKITKYNLGLQEVTLPLEAEGKRTILIPGQVDSDASITFGSPKIRNNKELVAEVKKQHPDAYICYKPHPDLLAGARSDKPLWEGIHDQIDHLVTEGDIISWIQTVDEIHTLTSTVGMEALLHKKPVFTYGLPFYAGWGLTTDWLNCSRRNRNRSLLELVAAAYLEYPTYLNPQSGEFTTALNAAKIISNPNFTYDSRPKFLKIVGDLKATFNKITKH